MNYWRVTSIDSVEMEVLLGGHTKKEAVRVWEAYNHNETYLTWKRQKQFKLIKVKIQEVK